MHSIMRGALALTTALTLAACGGGGGKTPIDSGGPGNGSSFAVTASEWAFAPDAITTSAGAVVVTVTNGGVIEHDFTIEGTDLRVPADAAVYVKAAGQDGSTVEETLELTPGTYTYYCSVPGHREQGMEGTLTVS